MDYDDNDFQGQNLHLAGEGSSKFPPVLQPYALPKFDFDDSLPGHLRFDSLVENEVFLGIPSQEDNQWIEDFSRGSSGIEFGSSAAESCSISRHNNVWSEATSSESVEMLLKSVGQEEMVPGETIIEESDACDELGSLTKQMESNSRQADEKNDVIESHPASPPDECLEHLSGLNESSVEVTLQTQEMLSAYASKNELDPNAVSEKGGLFVAEKNSEIDGECNENQSKVEISADESLDDIMHKDPSVSGIQIHKISSVDAVASVSKQASNINAEGLSGVPKDIGDGLEEDHVMSKRDIVDDENLKGTKAEAGTYNLENSLVYSSIMECTEGHEGETNTSNSEEPSSLALKDDGELQKAGSNIKGQAIDVRNIQDGVCGSSEIDSPMQIIHGQSSSVEKEENFLASDCQFNSQASVSNSEASLFSGQGNTLSNDQGDGNGNSHEGDPPKLIVECTSTELLRGKHVTENLEGVNDASAIHKDPNAEDHVSPSMSVVSMQISERDFDSKEGDVYHNHHGAFDAKGNVKPPSDSSSLNYETFGPLIVETNVQSSCSVDGINGKDTMDHELEYDTSARNEPALEVSLENTEHKTLDGVPSAYEISDQSKEQKSAVHAEVVVDLDKKEETRFEVSTEGSLPTHLHGASELDSVSGVEKGACEDSAGQLMQSSGVETCNAASQSEPAMVSDEVSQDDSKKLEVSHDCGEELLVLENHEETVVEKDHEELSSEASVLVPSKSDVFTDPEPVSLVDSCCNMDQKECETNEAIAASGVNDYGKTAPITEVDTSDNHDANCVAEIGGCSSGSEKATCGSPTIISSSEVCHSEKDSQADVNKVKSTSENPIENEKDQRSFTFEVSPSAGLSESETSKGWQSFPTIQACKISTVVEGSPSISGAGQFDSKTASEISRRTPRTTDGENSRRGSKGTPERKTRRVSAKGTRKENTKRGNQATPPGSVSISPSATGQLVQLEGLKPYRNVEPKPCGVISIPTSNLPDLNSSTPPSALFQQPFTDLQQVQLRAQIFVYGSLIQGAVPDEACMISAFGTSDGGRSIWEPAWHACVERIQGQKSHSNNVETPLQSRSGARVSDQATKQAPIQSKVLSSPVGRAGSKSTPPSPVVNSMIPLSSPLWSMSTASCDALQSVSLVRGPVLDYHQALSSLHPYQTPPTRNFVGHNASWLSQAPFPGAWVASPQTSAFDASSRFSMLPITESVKLTPIKESSVPISSGTKPVSPSPVVHSGVPSVFAGTSQQIDMKKATQSPGQKSTDPKSRKRKKVQVSEDIGQISFLTQTQTQSVSAPLVTGHLSTSMVVSTPVVLSTSSNDDSKRGDQNAEKKVVIAEESFSKDEVAKAEEASALASAAVNHSQSVLSHLDKQKNSGLISDIEAKLASAAVTISAAVAVVNAAALATKIASNAVLQAKLMANEALGLSGSSISPLDAANNLGIASHASSIIVAAREAVRRRVEAASAASKHAENLDTIVKAAELVAEAVSQAGKVVAMGDPLPLNIPSEQGAKSKDVNKEQSHIDRVDEGPAISAKRSKVGPRSVEIQTTNQVMPHLSGAVTSSEKDLRAQRGFRASDLAKTIGVVPESESGPSAGTSKETSIKEGCLVEVFKDGDDTKAAWFSAKVLSLKDGNVFVCYNELQSDGGPLSEWVALEGNSAPRIRITHSINTMRLEGARKRRRAALGDYAWSVGDKVDAWVENCWREGVVTEKNAKDETTLTVRFPAEGETSLVRAWHLRPTLIWKDGEWIEWSSSRENDRASLGDTPKEKRLKLGGPDVDGKEEVSKNVDLMESGRPGESSLLPLSANEKLFNVGLHTIDENKPHTLGTIRTGLQKEGSKVIFGVPKPGKKRKFMDVSKHYDVAERNTKNTKLSDSISLAKYLMPQGSGLRGSKNNSKIDSKEKQAAESKSKALKPGKPQIGFGRSIPQKDKFPSSVVSSNVGPTKDHVAKDTSRHTELGSLSSIEEASEGQILFSSKALPSDARSKIFTSKAKSERSNKGRLAPSGTRSSKPEVKDNVYNRNPEKSISEAAEPRRSNRRIQPTSRLLEGLQSSLVISKFPASHEKSHKTQSRGTSKGNNNGGDELPK